MTAFVLFVAQHWRLSLALGVALGNFAVIEYWKYEAHSASDELAAYRTAGEAQNALTAQVIAAYKHQKELADANFEKRESDLAGELAATRVRLDAARSRGSFLPAAAPGARGDQRLCVARDVLDQGLGDIAGRLESRILAVAAKGQRGIDVAVTCRDWAAKLPAP